MTIHFLKWWRRSIIFLSQVCLYDQVVILTCFIILSASLVLLIGLRSGLFVPTLHEIAFKTSWRMREWSSWDQWCILVISSLVPLAAKKRSSYISTDIDFAICLILHVQILSSLWRTDIQLSLELWVIVCLTTLLSLLEYFLNTSCDVCLRHFLRVQFLYLRT